MGSCWATSSWATDSWAAGTWVDTGSGGSGGVISLALLGAG
jgi:hypothetical protein